MDESLKSGFMADREYNDDNWRRPINTAQSRSNSPPFGANTKQTSKIENDAHVGRPAQSATAEQRISRALLLLLLVSQRFEAAELLLVDSTELSSFHVDTVVFEWFPPENLANSLGSHPFPLNEILVSLNGALSACFGELTFRQLYLPATRHGAHHFSAETFKISSFFPLLLSIYKCI